MPKDVIVRALYTERIRNEELGIRNCQRGEAIRVLVRAARAGARCFGGAWLRFAEAPRLSATRHRESVPGILTGRVPMKGRADFGSALLNIGDGDGHGHGHGRGRGLGQSHILEQRFRFDESTNRGIGPPVGEANSLPPLRLAEKNADLGPLEEGHGVAGMILWN